ncbi:MAG: class I SAM-dependent methyltransferase, partial [Paracoccaceae bacterium]|nr:class I SAM-dependent methyltransferase [Paracoccaceae bacterium]
MNEQEAFFTLYERVYREGPGNRETLDWALSQIDIPKDGVICDAGCGSGADLGALLDHVPEGRVEGVDAHAPYVQLATERYADEPQIDVLLGNFGELSGPYDLIWSAGAIYFLGITVALRLWRDAVKDSGAVAFSQVFWKT